MDLPNALNVALDAAYAAGDLLRRGLNEHKTVTHKSSAVDLLTEYDKAAEALIIERLRSAFGHHQLIAEEGGGVDDVIEDASDGYVWYIDPLDGTNNFAHGYPVFAVSLALYERDRPLVGVVFDPMRNECFTAVSGEGAHLRTGHSNGAISVSQNNELLQSLLATGFPYDRHQSDEDNIAETGAFLKRSRGIRRAGAAALDLAYVAAGRLDGYWEFKLNSWDLAAGALLVQEAGGRLTDMDGAALKLSPNTSLVASNGLIHPAMLDVLASVRH